MDISFRPLERQDLAGLAEIYRKAAADPDGLIRREEEITEDYLEAIIRVPERGGESLGILVDGQLAGAIHAYPWPGVRRVRHLLTDLTIAIHPNYQGQKLGRRLFDAFLERIRRERTDILRVELYTKSDNLKNLGFYERLGFRQEGTHPDKILEDDGSFSTPVSMAWRNPNYGPSR